jgi:hypothetical protein
MRGTHNPRGPYGAVISHLIGYGGVACLGLS